MDFSRFPLIFIKITLYLWGAYELGVLANLYWLAFRESKESQIMRSLSILLWSLFGMAAFRLITLILTILHTQSAADFEHISHILIVIPIFFIYCYARRFRKESLRPDKLVEVGKKNGKKL